MPVSKTIACAAALMIAGSAANAATVVQTFGVGTNFDDGPGAVSFVLTGLPTDIVSALQLDFSFIGDLNSFVEVFDLVVDGTNLGTGCDFNTANGVFGNAADACSQTDNVFQDASLTVDQADAVGFLADGTLNIDFNFSTSVNDGFVDISNGGEFRSGVFFDEAEDFAFAAGGTLSYEIIDIIAPVPLPAGFGLLLLAIGGIAGFGRYQRVS